MKGHATIPELKC